MTCDTCKSSYAQHELRDELCLDCTRKELERVKAELHGVRSLYHELAGQACEFIGPDEDGKPECVCCGMALDTVSNGHKGDCLANAILSLDQAIGRAGDGYVPKDELERVRHLLGQLYSILPHPLAWTNEKMRIVSLVAEALSSDAGRGYVRVEDVKPLIEAAKLKG